MPNLRSLILSGVTNEDRRIDDLIAISKLERLFVSPNLFPTEEYAKFEARKFKINDEYGIYVLCKEEMQPLGIGKRPFKTEKAKEKFRLTYQKMMEQFANDFDA